MGKGNVKIYNFNHDGDYVLSDELDSKNHNSLEEAKIENIEINDELYINPFLFQINAFNSNYITSVENFYIKLNDSSLTFGNIVRNDSYSKKEKKKMIKNTINHWIEDANREIDKVFLNSDETIKLGKQNKLLKVKFINIILLLIGIIIPIILLLNIIPIINFTGKIYIISASSLIMLSILGIVFSIVQARKYKSFMNKINEHNQLHRKFYKKIRKRFKRNKKRIIKYYKKGFKKNKFLKDPLDIKEVQLGGEMLLQIKESSKDIQNSYKTILEQKSRNNFCYYIAKLLSYITSMISGGYIVVMLIIHILKLLFVKGE